MLRRWFARCGCVLLFTPLVSVPAFGSSLYSFASSNEGWQVVDFPYLTHVVTPNTAALPFDGAVGNPAGSVRVGDVFPDTGIMAPIDHLGNQSAIYGGTISYDILIRFTDNVAYPAVILNGGAMSIYYEMPAPTLGEWVSHAIPLTEAGWKISGTAAAATHADFMNILSNLTGIYIRTEWRTGPDDTNVDNISLPGGATDVAGTPSARGVVMQPAFPNPSGGSTEIAFTLGHPGLATVSVFDVQGRMVRTLASKRFIADGATVTWDGKTEIGEDAPSGIYFARVMTAGGDVATRKIVRVR
jgi:hypothetical protein